VAEVVDVGGAADGVYHDLVRQSRRFPEQRHDPSIHASIYLALQI
jgi:hypothetical protein